MSNCPLTIKDLCWRIGDMASWLAWWVVLGPQPQLNCGWVPAEHASAGGASGGELAPPLWREIGRAHV